MNDDQILARLHDPSIRASKTLPRLNIPAMIEYLRERGWVVEADGTWAFGYRCTSPGENCALNLAVERQLMRDVRELFRQADRLAGHI